MTLDYSPNSKKHPPKKIIFHSDNNSILIHLDIFRKIQPVHSAHKLTPMII